jgi:sec-independent protein translocase protein TatA
MWGIGTTEMIIVCIVAIILFGNRLPTVARSLGKSLTEFKKGMREFESEMKSSIYSDPPKGVTYDDKVEHATPHHDAPAESHQH